MKRMIFFLLLLAFPVLAATTSEWNIVQVNTNTGLVAPAITYVFQGELNLTNAAQVYRYKHLSVEAFSAPGLKPAELVQHGASAAWEFEDAKDEDTFFTASRPSDSDVTNNFSLCIGTSTAATNGTGVWQLVWDSMGEGSITTNAGATVISNFVVDGNTPYELYRFSFDGLHAPTNHTCFRFTLERTGTSTNDSLGQSAFLIGTQLKYLKTSLGE